MSEVAHPAPRRGNYSMMSALMILALAGFAAISIDISLARLAVSQAQDVGDAASQAAIVTYRESLAAGRTEAQARSDGEIAANYVIAKDQIVGGYGTLGSITWGNWNSSASPGSEFTATSSGAGANSVQVRVDRTGGNAVDSTFGKLFGVSAFNVRGNATSASRSLQVVLSMDTTGSWDRAEYYWATTAAVSFYDILEDTHGPEDRFGSYTWWSSYAYEYSPMMRMSDAQTYHALSRDLLVKLNVGNYAGQPSDGTSGTTDMRATSATPLPSTDTSNHNWHVDCKVYGNNANGGGNTNNGAFSDSGSFTSTMKNKWSATFLLGTNAGQGCHPTLPRYYLSESGTDHHTGLMLGRTMLHEQKYYKPSTNAWVNAPDPLAYKALVVLTDGAANSITTSATSGTNAFRYSDGITSGTGNSSSAAAPTGVYTWSYQDNRWPETWDAVRGSSGTYSGVAAGLREYRRDSNHSSGAVESDTEDLAADMLSTDQINIWFVSFREDRAFMSAAAVGDGYYTYVDRDDVDQLVPVFEGIARSLPTSIVK